jgi:pimeloyl-ACP methyl ester carboxylesterase
MSNRSWVFIRGLGRSSEHWEPFMSVFKNTFPDDFVELADIRGNGVMNYSPSYLSIADNVRDLRARSQFVREGRQISLMTISLGSMIGIEWAKLYPTEISELVVMNTSDRSCCLPLERLRPDVFKYLVPLSKTFNVPDMNSAKIAREKMILQMTTNRLPNLAERAKQWMDFPETSLMNLGRQVTAASLFAIPAKPPTKTLMLYSMQDRFVNPVCTQRIAKKWNLDPIAHATAGHDLPLEEPEWVAQKTKEWLSDLA